MFRSRTTLVLGAGASAEVDFPVGRELATAIAPMVNFYFDAGALRSGDEEIWEAIGKHARAHGERDLTAYLIAGRRIANAMPQAASIDAFLANNSTDKRIELVGKLAIVKSILAAERRSKLFTSAVQNERLDFEAIGQTWLNRFWQRLADGIYLGDLAERLRTCTIVTFNYDRCIEHYLYHAIRNYWAASTEQTAEILNSLRIYHPYGAVGKLPWQTGDDLAVDFGASQAPTALLDLAAQSVKTITEQIEMPTTEVDAIRAAMQESSVLVFLGFSFHRLNQKLLQPLQNSPYNVTARVYATAKGMSASDRGVVEGMLKRLRRGDGTVDYNVADISCCGLFDSYRKSLELA